MADMVSTELLPAAITYSNELLPLAKLSKQIEADLKDIISLYDSCRQNVELLKEKSSKCLTISDPVKRAAFAKDEIISQMETLRKYADRLESILPKKVIPYPTYEELLFSE